MDSSLRLDSSFAAPLGGHGIVRLRLVNAGADTYTDFRFGFSSYVQLTPTSDSNALLVERIGTYHELAPPDGFVLPPGSVWDIGALDCEFQLVHVGDGPAGAFVINHGSTLPVRAVPTERLPTVAVGNEAPPPAHLDEPGDVAGRAWATAAGCEARLYPDDARVLGTEGIAVAARIDEALGPDDFSLASSPDGTTVAAGSEVAMQWAFMELARRQRAGGEPASTTLTPRHGFRGFMIDLSRHFHPAVDVDELIDLAAWRRLNRMHLHLTDDQAWRVPIAGYPALTEVGAWRGHGLPIPPLNGSGPAPYGGSYTVAEIRRWVAHAAELGIELIPEIDVPGHCYAALVALPELLDPDDTSPATSVHHFPRNVLNPGLTSTRKFLETVFGEVADLFPSSSIHIGGDEVADAAWQQSPAALRYASERDITGSRAIETAFVREIVDLVATTTGRRVGAWQEAALSGAMRPTDGYVVGWKSTTDCQRLAAAGYEVVAAPAEAYYLDMAAGPEWHRPGVWWAGWVTNDSIAAFDVAAAWSDTERANLAGIQACLWGEPVPDRATMRALLLPRLDAFGDAGWRTAL